MLLFNDSNDVGTSDMSDGTGLAEQLLGLDGFKVLEVTEGEDETIALPEAS